MDEVKIKRFMQDKVMSESVKAVMLKAFLKTSGSKDVQTLAAERIAIDLLEEAYRELNKYASQEEKEEKILTQVGL